MSVAHYRFVGLLTAAALINVADVRDGVAQGYVRLDAGWSGAKDAELSEENWSIGQILSNSTGTGPATVNDIGSSYVFGVGLGYRFARGIRADIAASYRGNYELDDVDQRSASINADVRSQTVMANLYYDIPFQLGPLRPFIGAGIGIAINEVQTIKVIDVPNLGGTFTGPGGTTTEFAWQGMAGISWEITPNIAIEVGYRYLDAGNLKIEPGALSDGTAYSAFKGKLTAHEGLAAVRWTLP
jgi:opacity protein-like surface antigen